MDTINPVVSVIIPVFNRAQLVVEALHSLAAQTFKDWEAIVVDDGSTDGSGEAVSRFAANDPRVGLIRRTRPPKGGNTCRNLGLATARTDWIIFLDSDDLLAPHCLQQRIAVMRENPSADLVVFQGAIFNHTPGDTSQIWNILSREPDLHRFLRGDSVWQTAGPIWKKSALQKVGGWDEEMFCWQDVDLHVRALSGGLACVKRFNLPPDYFFRWHTGPSLSQGRSHTREHIAGFMKFCAKVAVKPGATGTPGETAAVRLVFARMIFLALDNMFIDLAQQGIRLAQKHGIISPSAKIIWPMVCASYRLRTRGLRGFAWLGERMFTPYLPPPDTLFTTQPSKTSPPS